MTAIQLAKAVNVARRHGVAVLMTGGSLEFNGHTQEWTLKDVNGQVVDNCTGNPEKHFDYLVD